MNEKEVWWKHINQKSPKRQVSTISDKADFHSEENYQREDHDMIIKVSVHQEDVTILSKYVKQNCIELNDEANAQLQLKTSNPPCNNW